MSNKATAAWRVRLAQIEVEPGAPSRNGARMLQAIAAARAAGVDLILFPEMAVPGRFVGDLWRYPSFVRQCVAVGEAVCQAAHGLIVVFGNVACVAHGGGEQLHNALFVAEEGRFCTTLNGRGFTTRGTIACDRSVPDCGSFSGNDAAGALWPTTRGILSATIGLEREAASHALALCRELRHNGARLLVNISSTPFVAASQPHAALFALARQADIALCHVNAVGMQDQGKAIHVFAGNSLACRPDGILAQAATPFAEAVLTVALDAAVTTTTVLPAPAPAALMAQAIIYGTGGMLRRLGLQRLVIGLSGGIDSALTALVYSRLVAPENLLLLNLPGPFTSATTRNLARHLATALQCRYAEVPITPAVALTRQQFAEIVVNGPGSRLGDRLPLSDYDLENVQARDRGGRVLAAAAAAFGAVISCNANKSELTVGYGTLYGDICGWLAAIGDLWKGEVYAVARHINEEICARPAIPEGVFAIKPSAELSAAQAVDEGQGDPLIYPYHDRLFRAWVEDPAGVTDRDVVAWYHAGELEQRIGYDGSLGALFADAAAFEADIARWWRLYRGLAIAKRLQSPPVLALSRAPFGTRMESQCLPHS